MEVDEESDQKSDIKPHWTAAHSRLKNEFTEDEKYHNLMRWLNYRYDSSYHLYLSLEQWLSSYLYKMSILDI